MVGLQLEPRAAGLLFPTGDVDLDPGWNARAVTPEAHSNSGIVGIGSRGQLEGAHLVGAELRGISPGEEHPASHPEIGRRAEIRVEHALTVRYALADERSR